MKPITRDDIAMAICPSHKPGEICDAECAYLTHADRVWALLHSRGREGLLHEGVIEEGDWAVYPDEPDLPGGRRVLVLNLEADDA